MIHRLEHSPKAFKLRDSDSNISSSTLLRQLKECRNRKDLEQGKHLHSIANSAGYSRNIYVANTLISMYSKCGDIFQARSLFDTISEKTIVSWNIIIQGYVENGEYVAALEMFSRIDNPPDSLTFVAAIKACIGLRNREKGSSVHEKATECGLDRELIVSNTLIDMYCKLQDLVQARDVFKSMKNRDVVTWTTLIVGYVEHGHFVNAFELFGSMDCKPNPFTFSAVIKACRDLSNQTGLQTGLKIHRQVRELGLDKDTAVSNSLIGYHSKYGNMYEARAVFDGMQTRDTISWNTLILGYVENGEVPKALELFRRIEFPPTPVTFVTVLKACTAAVTNKKSCLESGIQIHRLAESQRCDRDVSVSTTLIDMYSKSGRMTEAQTVFDRMRDRTVVTWNVLILGYVANGHFHKAMEVFKSMDFPAERMTFVGVLRACAGLGDGESGRKVYRRVCEMGYEADELVLTCSVDMFGKAGNLKLAEAVFDYMSCPDTVSWTALIGGYSSVGDVSRVLALVDEMEEYGARVNDVTVQLVLTACREAGLVDRGRVFLESMRERGVPPTLEQCACMVDMLARANKLEEALDFVVGMDVEADSVIWTSLLRECANRGDVSIGKIAFDALVALDEDKDSVASAYVLMRNIYEKLGMRAGSR